MRRKQCGDAQRAIWRSTTILVQSVNDEEEETTIFPDALRRLLQHVGYLSRRLKCNRYGPAGDRSELADERLAECSAISLTSEPRTDEEGYYGDPFWCVESKPRHQRGLARPWGTLPPLIPLVP